MLIQRAVVRIKENKMCKAQSPAQSRTLTGSSHPQKRIRLVDSPGPLGPHIQPCMC